MKKYLISAVVVLTAACFGGRAQVSYYSLTPVEMGITAAAMPDSAVVAVGPVVVAEILKRREIVVRAGSNRYRSAGNHLWGGVLERDVTSVLVDNIAQVLGTARVYPFPGDPAVRPDYRVAVDVVQLDGAPGEETVLRARWSIVGPDGTIRHSAASEFTEKPADDTIGALVATESALLGRLSRVIAEALKTDTSGTTGN